ncbi:ABC transporter permease [Mangrovactinospora gilvigrisea]|uniref:ABC transporter permease n=1 Tax=Mangrovactinospora gilvigrisea TaxID=1428644 RepID=A0A1J7BGI0_9ACTN|nr:carbohydrate ABC transporter permease [Mangrovactinospora gilvigrisea]OIV37669.1 ABC transporter permease [Mangrovactinospora gilvigrisea]
MATLDGFREARAAWQEEPKAITKIGKAVALVVFSLLILIPFLEVLATSVASGDQITKNGGWVLWPEHPTFGAYSQILNGGVVTRSILVSIGITVVGTAISLFGTITLAYALGRPHFKLRRPLTLAVLFTFLFPTGMLPGYLVVKQLGLLNSYWSLILPVAINVFNLVVVRGFFQNIPEELYEQARIDGASEWQQMVRIVLPLSRAVIAVVGLFYAVSYWNSFFSAILYLNDSTKWPVQAVLQLYVTQGADLSGSTASTFSDSGSAQALQSTQMAVVVLATLPVLLAYPFVQRHFTKGVLTGAVKS